MSAPPTRYQPHLHTVTRLRHLAAVLAAVTGGLLAWAAVLPGASAATLVIPDPGGGPYEPVPAVPGGPVRVITAGGMPGWQIILIAVAAALVAATVAILLDRVRVRRRSASAIG
jgi:hypothetical protein